MTPDLEQIPGIGPKRAKALRVAGYETLDDLEAATEEELRDVALFDDILARDIKATVSPSAEDPVAVKAPHSVSPADWQVTSLQAAHLQTLCMDHSATLAGATARDLRERLEPVLDPELPC
ncbi:MAG: helix-hairpin-helix domain-containing protein [Salinarchaeum sp.]